MKAYRALLLSFITGTVLSGPPESSHAGEADKGTTAAQFLKLPVGARAVGMGEAYSAVADEAGAIYWNPAALTRIEGQSLMLMHAALFADITNQFLGYGRRAGESWAWGAGIQYLSIPSIEETDSSGFSTGSSFSPRDMALSLGLARKFKFGSLGLSGKYISSKISNSATAYAADFGFLSRPYSFFDRDLRLAFVIQNLGTGLKYIEVEDPLPLNIKAGSSYSLSKRWLAALDVSLPKDNKPILAAGTEYKRRSGENWTFAGRLGFNSRTLGDIEGFSGISFGLGAGFRSLGLDYAFLPFGDLGAAHRISILFSFGKPKEKLAKAARVIEITTEPSEFSFERYLSEIQSSFFKEWKLRMPKGEYRECQITLIIARDGTASEFSITAESPDAIFNYRALAAAKAAKLPPLPKEFDGESLILNIKFKTAP